MHPLSCALPLQYVPAHVALGASVAHRLSFAPPRSRTSHYRRTFVPHSASLCNDLSDPVFDGVGLEGFKSRANAFLLALICILFLFITVCSFSFRPWVGCVGLGLCIDKVHLISPNLALLTLF